MYDLCRWRPRVINLDLSWREAAEVAAGLAAVTVALRTSRKPRLAAAAVATREAALAVGLFALWQYAGSFSVLGRGGALARSRWIWHFERAIHLPSETTIQRFFLPHPLLIQFFNLYYDTLHFPVLIGCMTWLFIRHRDRYGQWRTTVVAFTGLCLLVQLIPVAPPRMLPGTGLVDTAVRYHESVYSSTAGFDPDQLSAMPSVHVGWALLVAVAVITTARTRWRWLAALYPCLTILVVIVTANHFWLDGIVAAALLMLVLAAQAVARRASAARRDRQPAPATEPPVTAGAAPVPSGQSGSSLISMPSVCASTGATTASCPELMIAPRSESASMIRPSSAVLKSVWSSVTLLRSARTILEPGKAHRVSVAPAKSTSLSTQLSNVTSVSWDARKFTESSLQPLNTTLRSRAP
jgi:hypothetical protein